MVSFGSYEGEVSFLPSDSPSHPGDGNICYSDCKICFSEESNSVEDEKQAEAAATTTTGTIVDGTSTYSSTSDPAFPNSASIAGTSSGGSSSTSAKKPSSEKADSGVFPIINTTKDSVPFSGDQTQQSKDVASEGEKDDKDDKNEKDVNQSGDETNAEVSGGESNDGFIPESLACSTTATSAAKLKATTTTEVSPTTITKETATPPQRPTSMLDLPLKQKILPHVTSASDSSSSSSALDSSLGSEAAKSKWISVEGKFIGVNCIMMSARYDQLQLRVLD